MTSAATTQTSKTLSLIERVSVRKIRYLLEHRADIMGSLEIKASRRVKLHEALDKLEAYLKRVKGGILAVKYEQKSGIGRFFAKGDLTLQRMPRELRHTLAADYYVDIDMMNAQPTLALQYLEKHRIPCPALKEYVENREGVLADIVACNPELERADAKTVVLAILNGGKGNGLKLNDFLTRFQGEVRTVQAAVREIEPAIFQRYKDDWNEGGKAFSAVLSDIENRCLMAMKDCADKLGLLQGEAVLCFDGLMLRKSAFGEDMSVDDFLRQAEDAVKRDTGFWVQLAEKPMDEGLPVPDDLPQDEPEAVIIRGGDSEAADLFLASIKDDLKLSHNRLFARIGGIWTDEKEAVQHFMIDRALRANFQKEVNGRVVPYSCNVSGAEAIVKATKARMQILTDDGFLGRLWSSNKGKLVWKNGVFDFATKTFQPSFDGVESVIRIGRDFPARDPELMEEVYRRVLNPVLGDKLRKPFLQMLARAMGGHVEDKVYGILMGERNCGKGVLGTLLISAFGPYIAAINAESFMFERIGSGDPAKKSSWMFAAEFARIALTNEFKMNADEKKPLKIDGNLIKRFASGGDMLMARKNHKDEVQFRVQATLLMACNDLPPMTPADAYETAATYNFPNKFVSAAELGKYPFYRLADPTIKSFCERPEVGDAFFWILADHYAPQPMRPTKEMLDFRGQFRTNADGDLVTRTFQITGNPNDFVKNETLRTWLEERGVNMSIQKLTTTLERRGAKKESKRINGQTQRVLTGLVLIPNPPEVDDDEEATEVTDDE